MGSKYTVAQKAASIKYLKEKTDSIQIRTPKGMKDFWRTAAATAGQSLQAYAIQAVQERMQRENGPYGPQAMNNT